MTLYRWQLSLRKQSLRRKELCSARAFPPCPNYFPPVHNLLCSPSFHKMLAADEMRAWYGPDQVALAADRGAIGTLLISDELFRYVLLILRTEMTVN